METDEVSDKLLVFFLQISYRFPKNCLKITELGVIFK